MIKNYLKRFQLLQERYFDTKINIEIGAKHDENGWFSVTVTTDGWEKLQDSSDSYLCHYFFKLDFENDSETLRRFDAIYKEVIDFIARHKEDEN